MSDILITKTDPKSPISECFRALRTNIQFKNSNNELKTLLVTSTMKSAGKSIITANLGIAYAQAGKKVVIIDTDMRKSSQHTIFCIVAKPGLSNYLSGINYDGTKSNSNILKYARETEIENLHVIPAGTIPPNPSELLSLEKTAKMIDKLKTVYDIILLDATPSLVVTDAIALSRTVDSTLLIASYNETNKKDLNKIQRDIENVGGKIEGIVLNKVPVSLRKYKDKYYYGNKDTKLEQTIVPKLVIQDIEEDDEEKVVVDTKKTTVKVAANGKKDTKVNTTKIKKPAKKQESKAEGKSIEAEKEELALVAANEPKSRLMILIQSIMELVKKRNN